MIHILSTQKSWIDGAAIQQLEKVAELNGVKSIVGLPDLHNGPVGMAMASEKFIYPHLIGNDLGCGMGFWGTDMPVKKAKIEKLAKKLHNFDGNMTDVTKLSKWILRANDIKDIKDKHSLGTIGGGNHFAELQTIEKIHNEEVFNANCGGKDNLYILVHSGSRSLGKKILDEHITSNGSKGLAVGSPAQIDYLQKHDYALKWAKVNRYMIAKKVAEALNISLNWQELDVCHNSITREQFSDDKICWVHRKGANPNNEKYRNGNYKVLSIIAGSRGSLSYIVKPTGNRELSNFSIAHGAGRKHQRSEMKGRLKSRYTADELTKTQLGSIVICEDKKLLYEEAPEAYKNIDQVIKDLVSYGLIEVVATMKPFITYKKGKSKWK